MDIHDIVEGRWADRLTPGMDPNPGSGKVTYPSIAPNF